MGGRSPAEGLYGLSVAVFDMDGVLLESESLWRRAEAEMSEQLGLGLTQDDLLQTMGVRMRDVAHRWYEWKPWVGPTPDAVADAVIDRVIELVEGVAPLAGVARAIEVCRDAGLRLALCSSSDQRLIEAVLRTLGLTDVFEVVHSAENDPFGKPHPAPYLSTAAELAVEPWQCVALEDSINGCVSAKAAGMRVIAVPDGTARGSGRFGFCDLVLDSLEHLDEQALASLDRGVPMPSISRPRFHLAFPVHDLSAARRFYGQVLGCPEGRSSPEWVDFDLWGHQIVAHVDRALGHGPVTTNPVDGEQVPVRHFGLLLHSGAWHDLVDRLRSAAVPFLIEPQVRFAGEAGEQLTCFVRDPSGNALEFKAFTDDRAVFAT